MAKCFLPRLYSTQEHRCATRVKDGDTENYLQEAFPGGLCLCASSEPVSSGFAHTSVTNGGERSGDGSRKLCPNSEQTFFLKSTLALSPRRFSSSGDHASQSETEKAEMVQVQSELLGIASKSLLGWPGVLPPTKMLFPSRETDVPGMGNVELSCKSLEHHPSWTAAPRYIFLSPLHLHNTTESNPITETIAFARSRIFNGPLQRSQEAQQASETRPDSNTSLMRPADWACPSLPLRNRGSGSGFVSVHQSRRRGLAGPAAALRRRRQLQSRFENVK